MRVERYSIEGPLLITPEVWRDRRGEFLETFRASRYSECGIPSQFLQDNLSLSQHRTLRGMHFQSGRGQGKLVSVVVGEIFDVAVDIRPGSPTFAQWMGVTLNSSSRQQFYIPPGFAHGFCVLSESAIVCYKVTAEYDAETECGFAYNDPEVAIRWPVEAPLLSDRDLAAPSLSEVLEKVEVLA